MGMQISGAPRQHGGHCRQDAWQKQEAHRVWRDAPVLKNQ